MLIRTFGILCFLLSFETGFPQTICPTGKFGENCDQDCSSNCFKNCHKTTGACIDACIIGKYGSHCNDDCSECQFGCDKDTGACPCDLYGCAECGSTNGTCQLCDETRHMFPSSVDPLKCCSRGCPTQQGGVLDCHANGVCKLEGCLPDYWGDRCTKCSNMIEHCNYCSFLQNTDDLICRECLSGYTLSNDEFRCCPVGCDDCSGDVCSKCKDGYYIYGEICDTCGEYCNPPSNGSARCDPNTGRCYYGCLEDWHGSQCQKHCDLPNCETCDYFEEADRLTCITCSDGYAPNATSGLCETCNSNCIDGSCDSSTGSCTEGCLPGWRADRCDMTCAQAGLSNCSVCGRDDSTCSKCLFDFWGAVCEMGCSEHCVPVDDDNVCHKDTAACARGCLPGYWQDDCTNECPNCLGDLCQIDDGICQQNACKPGYWGRNCMSPCSSTCADNPATGDRECGFQNGFCTHGCKYNRYGDICEKDCSRNCFDNTTTTNPDDKEPLCYQESAICKWGCNDGYYHRDCTGTCESTCVTGACDILEGYCLECNKTQPGWLCYSGVCDKGFQGEYCNVTCPTNCKAECERYVTKCKGCIPSFWGDECKTSCHNCQNGICNQTSGVCDVGCNPGYFNPYCEQPCVFGGCKTCNRNSGLCITCKDELHGEACERNCSKQCTPDRNGLHMCYKDTGVCEEGSCLAGAWGLDCSQSCNINCKKDAFGDRVCYYLSGNCSSGCEDKFWDDQCDKPCSDTCLYGLCKRDSTCLLGCEAGTYGAGCEKDCKDTCNDGTCDRLSGLCMECNKTLEEQTELCRTAECPSGVKGLYCNESCPDNCFETCNRYNDTCAGCKSGFYGDLCEDECRECVGGSCTQTTGTCEEGCVAGWYGLQCNKKCLDNECQICDVFTGTCTECKPSYYGNKCEKNCSSFCAESNDNTIRCDIILGHCSAAECKDGYYLKDCTKSCNEKCGKDFKDERPCNILTGKCMHDCEPGWYGDMCDRECSVHCEDGLCNRTGHCITGCETGFYGGDCRLTCAPSLTCNDGTCHRYNGNCSACDEPEPTPRCTTADCDKGSYGLYCNMTCPVNCYGGVCIRDSGLCQDCNSAWYGSNCTSRCPNCKEDICIQSNGHCIRGCKDGFYKDKCDEPCLYEGCQDCSRDSGMCITCKVGKYNSNCSEDCSPRCEVTDKGLRTCSKASGDCDAKACIPGYWSETCKQECSSYCDTTDNECDLKSGTCTPCKVGHFGLSCRLECSIRCKNQNCDRTLDNCLQGCADGFWGAACEKQCNGNCQQKLCNISSGACTLGCERDMFYGPTCKEPCNSNCVGGECETDGYCRDGCKTGTYGRGCENACPDKATCTDGTCDRILGYCSECDAADPGPLCPTAVCPSGKWGLNCTINCSSSTCLFNRCRRDDGICIGCPIGRTGSQCDKFCGQCKVGTGCNQLSGFCDEGCRDGYYGDECKQQCDPVCKSCERQPPAKCVECTDNRWGSSCLQTCNPNCAKTIKGTLEYTLCAKDTGYCSEGACINNKNWNDDCSKPCPQNCLPDNNGYKTCRISDGACSIGCVATYYGVHCTERCSTQCRGQICKDEANNCVNGCENGFYNPPTCSGTCSEHCKESRNCDRVTGTCADGCAAGYFGLQCIEQCYGKCKDGTCDDLGGCPDCRISPVGPNCHPQVCPPLKYGPSCESDCPGLYCKDDACHRQTGKCPQGCRDWFHGEYCTERCICHVAGTTLCNQTGICECKASWTSVDCSQRCSDGCRNSVCEKTGQCTFGCIAGRYGTTCENKCTNCVNEACDSDTGKCDIGCKPGYYGMRCDSQCPENCYTCDSASECTTCLPFRYGLPSCNQRCSSTCKQPSSGRVCYESNGACIGGCLLGFWDEQCTRQCGFCGKNGTCLQPTGICTDECDPGYTTPACTTPCSDSCAKGGSKNQRECQRDTGACEHGCETGYHGDFCEPCSDRCLNNKCSSAFICTDGCKAYYYSKKSGCNLECSGCQNGRCNDTGGCLTGCAKGFHGTMCTTVCSKTCTDGTCDQLTGQCKDCKETPVGPLCREPGIETATVVTTDERLSMEAIIGISAGCAVAVILIAILMVCCVFYRRKATDAKNEIHLPSEVLERLSNHGRSHHSTISSQYPVARVVGDDEKDFVLF